MDLLGTFGKRIALGGAIAIFLVAGSAHAQTTTKGAMKPPARSVPSNISTISIEEALQLTKKSPKDPNAYLALGGAYRRARRYEDAVQAFKKLKTHRARGKIVIHVAKKAS